MTVSLTDTEAKTLNPNAAKIRITVGTLGASGGTMYFDSVRLQENNFYITYTVTYWYEAKGIIRYTYSRELNWNRVAATGVLLAVIGSVIAAPLAGGASLGVQPSCYNLKY